MEGCVVWLTGLSGAGKSTLCRSTVAALKKLGVAAQLLDADDIRQGLCSDLGFSLEDRFENVRRIAHVARALAATGSVVLVAAISPTHQIRRQLRENLEELLEVFVDAPLSVCEHRDPKGLYKRARGGLISNFTGVDSPFELPLQPAVVCHTDRETIEESTWKIVCAIQTRSHRYLVERARTVIRRLTVAVDFDGVIADYDGWDGVTNPGTPRIDVISALRRLRSEGWKIIIYTSRSGVDLIEYLIKNEIPFDEINANSDYETMGKPVATVYWDDRAVCYSGHAANDLERIREFKTWSGRS